MEGCLGMKINSTIFPRRGEFDFKTKEFQEMFILKSSLSFDGVTTQDPKNS